MNSKLFILKIGGNVIDNPEALSHFLKELAMLKQPFILVHGGGKVATEIGKGLGVEAQMVDGRRITDAETLKIVTMVYGGLINKNIVVQLQANGKNAIGMTGTDGNCILASKRPVKNGIDYGFVGDIEKVNAKVLTDLLQNGLLPVIAPLTHDGKGTILNTNADTIASAIAVGMSEYFETHLVYCFELPGVLLDINKPESLIAEINEQKYQELKDQEVISKGMIPKMDNAFNAIHAGVKSVIICQATHIKEIINENTPKGTVLST